MWITIAVIGVLVLVLLVLGMVFLTRPGASRVRRSYAEDDDPQGAELSPVPPRSADARDAPQPVAPGSLAISRSHHSAYSSPDTRSRCSSTVSAPPM